MIMVPLCEASSLILVWRPFLWGKKPSKMNFSAGNPELTKAGTKAVAPGRHSTSKREGIKWKAGNLP